MRIGISILSKAGDNIWNSGIGQNVYHLANLLMHISFVRNVVLIDCGETGAPADNTGSMGEKYAIIPMAEALDAVDVTIEVAGGMPPEWIAQFRARGGKFVYHICGQPYAVFVEPTIFDKPAFFSEAERADEIWVLPKDAHFSAMLRAIHRCPIFTLPYLWSPVFLEDTIEKIAAENLHFGYTQGDMAKGRLVPAIFEPNISTIKMGLIPYLMCERYEREGEHKLERVHFMNTLHMAEQKSFVTLVSNTDLYKQGKTLLEGRDYFARVMGRGANMVVSHQLECDQNYVYLDALAGNYPLIHNSKSFADIGYYYPDSDIDAGLQQMQLAQAEHDHNLASYAARNTARIAQLSPDNRHNQDGYARRLLALNVKQGAL